jgi:hypothetical protein
MQTLMPARRYSEDAILACVRAGHSSLDEIVAQVYRDTPPALREVAKSNVQLHLRKLREEAKL